jgi:hypothetical protein
VEGEGGSKSNKRTFSLMSWTRVFTLQYYAVAHVFFLFFSFLFFFFSCTLFMEFFFYANCLRYSKVAVMFGSAENDFLCLLNKKFKFFLVNL